MPMVTKNDPHIIMSMPPKMTPLHVQFCPCSLKITPLYVHATKTDPPQSPHLIPDGFENVSENPSQNPSPNPSQNPAQKLGRASYRAA